MVGYVSQFNVFDKIMIKFQKKGVHVDNFGQEYSALKGLNCVLRC